VKLRKGPEKLAFDPNYQEKFIKICNSFFNLIKNREQEYLKKSSDVMISLFMICYMKATRD